MPEFLIKLLPVILIAIAGFILRWTKILTTDAGDLLLKLAFYLSMPALILNTLSNVNLDASFVFLTIGPVIVIFATFFIASYFASFFHMEKAGKGVFLVGSMILNTGFLLPFIYAYYGSEGFARVIFCDIANAFLIYTFIYYIACKHGKNDGNKGMMIKKLLFSPPLWAILIGLCMNLLGIKPGNTATQFLHYTGDMTIPIFMLCLGIYFKPKLILPARAFTVLTIRILGGLVLGFLLTWIFGLQGLTRNVLILAAASPVGYNTLTFTALEDLDREFASGIVSVSLLAGLFYVPLMIYLLEIL